MDSKRHSESLGSLGNKVVPISVKGISVSARSQISRRPANFRDTPAPFRCTKAARPDTTAGFGIIAVNRRCAKVAVRDTTAALPDNTATNRITKAGFCGITVDCQRPKVTLRNIKVGVQNTKVSPKTPHFPLKSIKLTNFLPNSQLPTSIS